MVLAVGYEDEGLRLSVFKYRGAELNRAIFEILAVEGPLTAYQVYKHIRERREFEGKYYSVVNRRIRKLREQGYLKRLGKLELRLDFKHPCMSLQLKLTWLCF